MKIKKLTKQYSGGDKFTHMVQYIYKNGPIFVEHRQWCWETWGPSCELDYYYQMGEKRNPSWCWMSADNGRIRIYFGSEKEAAHFGLRWS
jgi:hypothetical protein